MPGAGHFDPPRHNLPRRRSFDLNLVPHGPLVFGQRHSQDAIQELRFDLPFLQLRRQSKHSAEGTVPAFDMVEGLPLPLLLLALLGGDPQRTTVHLDFHFLGLHARKFDRFLGLGHVRFGRKSAHASEGRFRSHDFGHPLGPPWFKLKELGE
jgi:hypothetical protein